MISGNPHIISTRRLNSNLKTEAIERGFSIEDKDFLEFNYIIKKSVANQIESNQAPIVFTSQHALRGIDFLQKEFKLSVKKTTCYAIAGATSNAAEILGFEILATGKNASDLATKIIQNNETKVLHCTTKQRRKELSEALQAAEIEIEVCEIYSKKMFPQKVGEFDGVLVFSPSRFDAFTASNDLAADTPIFCIGHTTAGHAHNLNHKNIIVAKQANETAVLASVFEYFR